MSWGAPVLLLLLLVPLAGVPVMLRLMRRRSPPRWQSMCRIAVSGNRVHKAPRGRTRPPFVMLLAITLALIALARPRWGEQDQQAFSNAREVMIALDLSRSMLAEDVEPSRLDHAQALAESLLDGLAGERVGLIVFAGTAFVQVPLSSDYQIIREFLPDLRPDYMPQGGSDYTGMLKAALEGFSETPDVDRYLIVLSDGESTTEGWQDLLPELDKRQVRVLALGLGTEKGGFIRDENGAYLQDSRGGTVHSTLKPATLQTLARRTHGEYLNASSLEDVKPLLEKTVQTGRKGSFGGEINDTRKERFQLLLLPAVLLGLSGLLREFHQRPRPRTIRQRAGRAMPGVTKPMVALAAALLVASGTSPRANAHFDADAGFEVKEVFESNPVHRLRAIIAHLGQYGYDAYDIRLMVEETIKYGIDQQRSELVPDEGVIRDAIDATYEGERLDPTVADWGFYRARLTAMLKPPTEENSASAAQQKTNPLDEEDKPPTVAGQSTEHSATDSFGQGSSTKTDAALGDLSPDADSTVEKKDRTLPPPKNVRMAAVRAAHGGSGRSGPDPILEFSKERMKDVADRDSPGRVHQMLNESALPQQQDSNQDDW
jgi:Ca-activated chloride channel family protein